MQSVQKTIYGLLLLPLVMGHGFYAYAQINRGKLDETSTGQLQLSLEIRANNRDGVSISTPGNDFMPVRLPAVVTRALSSTNNANFPLCVSLQSGQSLDLMAAGEVPGLVDENGNVVPFTATLIKDSNSRGNANSRGCDEGEPIELQVQLDQPASRPGKRIGGNIFFILKNE
jgi:hypothetical protein